jgi:hypothetical protein
MLSMYAIDPTHFIDGPTHDLDSHSFLLHCLDQEVHQPEFRHHRSPIRAGQCRRCLPGFGSHPGDCDQGWSRWYVRSQDYRMFLLIQPVSTRQKAIRTAIAVVAGGYQTALVSYFVHRDLFPALMTVRCSGLRHIYCILTSASST